MAKKKTVKKEVVVEELVVEETPKTTTRIFEQNGKTYEKTYDAKGNSISIKEIK